MYVNNDIRVANSLQTQSASTKQRSSGTTAFGDFLAEAVGGGSSANPTASCATTAAAEPTSQNVQAPLTNQINNAIDALEQYGQALGNPNATLKQVGALLNDLKERASQLKQDADKSQTDPELAGLAEQISCQIEAESIKFQRGDYL